MALWAIAILLTLYLISSEIPFLVKSKGDFWVRANLASKAIGFVLMMWILAIAQQ